MKNIGFIGLGIMGKSMARNLMKAGFELHIYARKRAKVEDIIKEGALFFGSIRECVRSCQAVITMVGFPQDVEEVYFQEGGIVETAFPGTILIDMTTTSPSLAQRIWKEGSARGLRVMDAPVTGGDSGAREGTLSILAGGEKDTFNDCMELFLAMGNNINYQGKAGSGQHAKLVNQIMIAGALSGVCEGLSYARAKGLELPTVLKAVAAGAAGSRQLDTLGPKLLAGDYAPGFFMKHFVKDMDLACEEAKREGLDLAILEKTLEHCRRLQEEGCGEMGTQALMKFYEE